MRSPTNDLKIFLRKILAGRVGEKNVYDYLPGTGTPYPFVYIGESFSNDLRTKWGYGAEVEIRIHFFSDEYRKQGSFHELIDSCLYDIKTTQKNDGYKFRLVNSSIQVRGDNSTDKMLLQGLLELTFSFL